MSQQFLGCVAFGPQEVKQRHHRQEQIAPWRRKQLEDRRVARSVALRMLEFDEQIVNVPGHADAATPVWVVPYDGDTCKFVAGHVKLHYVVLLEYIK